MTSLFSPKSIYLNAIAIIALILLVHTINWPTIIEPSIKDSSHTWVFFFGSLIAINLARTFYSPPSKTLIIWVLAGCFALGVIIELVQPYLGRDRSILDIYYDFLGVAAGGLFYLSFESPERKLRYLSISALLLGLSLPVPILSTSLYMEQIRALPVIMDVESNWQSNIWKVSSKSLASIEPAPSPWDNNSNVLKLTLKDEKYPSFRIAPPPKNWQPYQSLSLDIYSEKSLYLTIRVHDLKHNNEYEDRFNKRLKIQNGLNQITIPLADIENGPEHRHLNLEQIGGLILFATSPTEPCILYMDNIVLKP